MVNQEALLLTLIDPIAEIKEQLEQYFPSMNDLHSRILNSAYIHFCGMKKENKTQKDLHQQQEFTLSAKITMSEEGKSYFRIMGSDGVEYGRLSIDPGTVDEDGLDACSIEVYQNPTNVEKDRRNKEFSLWNTEETFMMIRTKFKNIMKTFVRYRVYTLSMESRPGSMIYKAKYEQFSPVQVVKKDIVNNLNDAVSQLTGSPTTPTLKLDHLPAVDKADNEIVIQMQTTLLKVEPRQPGDESPQPLNLEGRLELMGNRVNLNQMKDMTASEVSQYLDIYNIPKAAADLTSVSTKQEQPNHQKGAVNMVIDRTPGAEPNKPNRVHSFNTGGNHHHELPAGAKVYQRTADGFQPIQPGKTMPQATSPEQDNTVVQIAGFFNKVLDRLAKTHDDFGVPLDTGLETLQEFLDQQEGQELVPTFESIGIFQSIAVSWKLFRRECKATATSLRMAHAKAMKAKEYFGKEAFLSEYTTRRNKYTGAVTFGFTVLSKKLEDAIEDAAIDAEHNPVSA